MTEPSRAERSGAEHAARGSARVCGGVGVLIHQLRVLVGVTLPSPLPLLAPCRFIPPPRHSQPQTTRSFRFDPPGSLPLPSPSVSFFHIRPASRSPSCSNPPARPTAPLQRACRPRCSRRYIRTGLTRKRLSLSLFLSSPTTRFIHLTIPYTRRTATAVGAGECTTRCVDPEGKGIATGTVYISG